MLFKSVVLSAATLLMLCAFTALTDGPSSVVRLSFLGGITFISLAAWLYHRESDR